MAKMKDSGIEEIGLIPENWNRILLEHCAYIVRGGSPRPIEQYMSDDGTGYNWIKIGDTEKGNKYITHVREKIKASGLYKTRIVHTGDLLLTNSMSFGEPYILKGIEGCIHDGWLAFSNLKQLDKEFLYYLLVSKACRTQFEKSSDGGVVLNLNIDKVKHTVIYYPSLSTQKSIADFLDSKCAKIDSLKNDIEKQIETLEQYKKSVITEAVTKGINPDVKMKDSGIEWIGEIPEHWEVANPKWHFTQRKDRAKRGLQQLTASQKYGVITQDEYMDITGAKVVTVAKDFDILKLVRPGDFVIHMRSFQGGLEYSEKEGSISSAYVMLIPQKTIADHRFYKWFFKSPIYIDALSSTTNLVRDGQAMRYANFIQIPIVIPSAKEQKDIADYLDAKCNKIDSIIASKQHQLETLEEYKKSLIFEYVTGKKEV